MNVSDLFSEISGMFPTVLTFLKKFASLAVGVRMVLNKLLIYSGFPRVIGNFFGVPRSMKGSKHWSIVQ